MEPTHTHYSPYRPPRQVAGTLLDCTPNAPDTHRMENSELWADYTYSPAFGPESSTGLPSDVETSLREAYMRHRNAGTEYRITDVVSIGPDGYGYRVAITNRTGYNGDGPTWHTEEWEIVHGGEWHGVSRNPHPGYEHYSASCPNCGY